MAKYYQPKGYRFKKGTIKCGDIRLSWDDWKGFLNDCKDELKRRENWP